MLLSRLSSNVLPPRAALLAADVLLLSVPEHAGVQERVFAGCEPPYGTVAVQSASGPHRIAVMRRSSFNTSSSGGFLSFPSEITKSADETELFSTVVLGSDIVALAEDLDQASQCRLLGFLLGFCRKAFGLAEHPEFASACRELALLCASSEGTIEPVARATNAWLVTDGWLNHDLDTALILGAQRVRRSTVLKVDGFPTIRLLQRIDPDDIVLVLGERPAIYSVGLVRAALPDLVRGTSNNERLRTACLRALAPLSTQIRAHLRETAVMTAASARRYDDANRPIGAGLEAALSDGVGGLFLRGWLRDPLKLIDSVEIADAHKSTPIDPGLIHRFRRPEIDKHYAAGPFADSYGRHGFVAFVENPSDDFSLQPTLILRLHSGARVDVRAPLRVLQPAMARTAVLSSVPLNEVSNAMLDDCLGPAAASFHRQALGLRGTPDVIQIGAAPLNPSISIIIPLYRNLSFLRFQLAAFARTPKCCDAEIIFVLDSPEQFREVEHLLRGLHAMHGLPMNLIILPENVGYAAANNAGAAHARGRMLLLLNSDVIPLDGSWLDTLTCALDEKGTGAVGPKLLFDDDSIQHAGLFFQRDVDGMWLNAHYFKGMPRRWPKAQKGREVPGITGAALLVHRRLFEAVGGVCEDYIVGDYEDSDFCLRLRREGMKTIYVPSAELYHFERRSISLHKGYTGTVSCRYNQRLQHARWNDTISALMAASSSGVV